MICLAIGYTIGSMSEKTGKSKGKLGSKPPRRHSAQVNFRLTPEHEELIRTAAEHSGQTLANWIRGVLVKAARQELAQD